MKDPIPQASIRLEGRRRIEDESTPGRTWWSEGVQNTNDLGGEAACSDDSVSPVAGSRWGKPPSGLAQGDTRGSHTSHISNDKADQIQAVNPALQSSFGPGSKKSRMKPNQILQDPIRMEGLYRMNDDFPPGMTWWSDGKPDYKARDVHEHIEQCAIRNISLPVHPDIRLLPPLPWMSGVSIPYTSRSVASIIVVFGKPVTHSLSITCHITCGAKHMVSKRVDR
jgi:hypothetical protein